MSEWVEHKLPCDKCGSSDAVSINDNDWSTCFSCGHTEHVEGTTVDRKEASDTVMNISTKPKPDRFEYLAHRGISERAFRKYEVSTSIVDDEPYEVGFVYPNKSIKARNYHKKDFHTKGDMSGAGLFGRDKFEANGNSVVITEGEYDALAVWDMKQVPAVSVRNAQSAKKDCSTDWDWLDSFERIYICTDSDGPGEDAARVIASLFDFNKVYRIKMRYKDANEYLQRGVPKEFVEAFNGARKYTPDNIINEFDDVEKCLYENREKKLAPYPFSGLDEKLFGMHEGEVICFKGPEGIGKTEVFRAIEFSILKHDPSLKLGILHLEEDQGTTIKGLATYESSVPYMHLEDSSDPKEIMKAYRSALGDDPSRMYIYSSFDVEDWEKLIDNIRFLVSSCGCKFIFLDHITWLATGLENEDERRILDRISQKIKLLAKELNFCFILISHTNDEGKTRGSRNITKAANTVINLSRNKEHPLDEEQTKTYFEIEKSRGGGTREGKAGFATYDLDTLRLLDPVTINDLPGVE